MAHITNEKRFSYPGYNEILTGFPNPEIKSNAKVPNQTPTVLEWLHHKPAFQHSVAAFSAWDVIPYIINRERYGFPVMGGWETVPDKTPSPRMALLNDLIRDMTRANDAEVYDAFIFQAAHEYLVTKHPRVLFVGFLETDHWAHSGRYDDVLRAAHQVDDYVRRLWETVQSLDQYRGKTTFIQRPTTDAASRRRTGSTTTQKATGRKTSGWHFSVRILSRSGNAPIARLSPKTRLPPRRLLFWGRITANLFRRRGNPLWQFLYLLPNSPLCFGNTSKQN